MKAVASANAKLIGQIENWRNRLLDIGNRNPLINSSFSATRGVLELLHPGSEEIWRKLITSGEAGSRAMRFPWKRDLVPPPPSIKSLHGEQLDFETDLQSEPEVKDWNPAIEQCTASLRLKADDILTEIGDRALDRRIRTLDGHARLSISEQGIHCLFIAFGFIKWFESADSTKEIRSPLILVPATFTRTTSDSPWELWEAEDDVIDNLCLRQRFKQDFGLALPPLPEFDQLEEDGARLEYLAEVRRAIAKNERWEVEDRCCLGRFAFPKIAMWQDLGDHIDSIAASPICQSIGGQAVSGACAAFGNAALVPDAAQLDDVLVPGEIKAILDCDSSQLEAIVAARHGISFVLDGPPGTGKSQTIANIIADALSVGKRVLFVSEKVAALEVVKRRLDDCGLGDFCLECHSSKANRKAVLEELKWCLEIPVETYPDPTSKLVDLCRQRQALNDYVRALHEVRQPIGMSIYNLYGEIARLTRTGMLGKSKIEFSKPGSISRSTLEGWIQQLRLAPRHRNVLDNFARHPWRGCQLSEHTLTLKSEIQSKFTLLAERAAQIAQDLRPLEEACLIPARITPEQLRPLLHLLEVSLATPDIPSNWFASPRDTARALLDRYRSHLNSIHLRSRLLEYVDDVTYRFSNDILPLSNLTKCGWIGRLTIPLPNDHKDSRDTFAKWAKVLRDFEGSLAALEQSLKQLIAEIKLPIRPDITIGSVSKLVAAARLVASDAPLRSNWFDPQQTPAIVATAQEALTKLEEIRDLELCVADRINFNDLLKLACEITEVDELARDWELIRANSQARDVESLIDFANRLAEDQLRLSRLDSDLRQLTSCLQWNSSFMPTMIEARAIVEAVPNLWGCGAYNGKWVDSSIRSHVKQQIESILLDIEEAEEQRRSLETKFSHRAFLPGARKLVDRGKQYTSWWKRLFGGYSNYRMEVADLYKAEVPDTKTLLSDLTMLATFHRRISEVNRVRQELGELILPNFVSDQPKSWHETLSALNAFDLFITALPQMAIVIPPGAVTIAVSTTAPLLSRLSASLQRTPDNTTDGIMDTLGLANMRVGEALSLVVNLQSSTRRCIGAIQAGAAVYFSTPEIQQLLADVRLAKAYAGQRDAIELMFDARMRDLPEGSQPLRSADWLAAIRGIESADKLIKTFGASPVLTEIVCTPGQVDREALAKLIESTDSAFQHVSKMWSQQVTFIDLTLPDEMTVEPRKRIISELKASVSFAAFEFETLSKQFAALASILKPGQSVSLDRLPQDAEAIEELRQAQSIIARCSLALVELGVDHAIELSSNEVQVCEWIIQASEDLLSSPVTKAIATSRCIRTTAQTQLTRLSSQLLQFEESWNFFGTCFALKENVSLGFVPESLPVQDLPETVLSLVANLDTLDEWLAFKRWRKELKRCHLYPCLDEVMNKQYTVEEAADTVVARFYTQLFDHFAVGFPQIGRFDGDLHEQVRNSYRELDAWEIKAASARVREVQLGRDDRPRIGWLAPVTSELGILKRETEKKRRHMPLRKLFNEVPGVLQRLKPCIMMSPLSVSTFLQSEALKFDLVIFDEASQVFPWDAIGSIYRGTQLIVAGDDKQLPPTSFFSRADIESEDEEDDIGDFESILSLCKSVNMPNKRLRWHYRSRREPLIAFSNKHFYDSDLVTFPSVRDASGDAVRLIHVEDGRWVDRKNLAEARRVAELAVQHYQDNPNKSLGVIAFNATQQQAIEDAIYELRRSSSVIDSLLKERPHEPMFIKNLENVQGDERDVILLSFGYAKNESGKFIKNFGPLSKPGGERRLNVAVTRAREALALVASVRSVDMDLSGSNSVGAALLKAYLDFAERGVDSLSQVISQTIADCESPFEEEVAKALMRHGLEPIPQVGCGGFRIDLALKHPAHPGVFCLGIECDGATYHSSKTARDRDRIRQSILENLGWRICRVWSSDWIRNPDHQIRRILSLYEMASAQPPDILTEREIAPELEYEDLQPKVVTESQAQTLLYQRIEDVPNQHIVEKAILIVTRSGTIDWSELVSLTSRELGFARTGRKIRARIESILQELCKRELLSVQSDRVSLGNVSA